MRKIEPFEKYGLEKKVNRCLVSTYHYDPGVEELLKIINDDPLKI